MDLHKIKIQVWPIGEASGCDIVGDLAIFEVSFSISLVLKDPEKSINGIEMFT